MIQDMACRRGLVIQNLRDTKYLPLIQYAVICHGHVMKSHDITPILCVIRRPSRSMMRHSVILTCVHLAFWCVYSAIKMDMMRQLISGSNWYHNITCKRNVTWCAVRHDVLTWCAAMIVWLWKLVESWTLCHAVMHPDLKFDEMWWCGMQQFMMGWGTACETWYDMPRYDVSGIHRYPGMLATMSRQQQQLQISSSLLWRNVSIPTAECRRLGFSASFKKNMALTGYIDPFGNLEVSLNSKS